MSAEALVECRLLIIALGGAKIIAAALVECRLLINTSGGAQ